jgi:tetratricopeptide (TPR) repeat protein
MEDKEKFFAYIKEAIDLFNKGEYGKSIDTFSAANYVDQNQTPYYWMAKARYKEGDVWRALYNFYLGLCYYKEYPGLVSRDEIHTAIKEIEPELKEKAPQYLTTWYGLKKDPRFK